MQAELISPNPETESERFARHDRENIARAVDNLIDSKEFKALFAMLGDNDLSAKEWSELCHPIFSHLELD